MSAKRGRNRFMRVAELAQPSTFYKLRIRPAQYTTELRIDDQTAG
jgi:hypothetical protein